MKVFEYLKISFWLILVVIVALLGLSHSFYGLLVSFQNSDLYEINLNNIEDENLKKNRYIKIINANSVVDPLIYVDETNKPVQYIYALSSVVQDSNHITSILTNSKIIIETKTIINDWTNKEIKGLLKPYWKSIDEEIISNFEYSGLKISENAEYLKLDTKPWKWYWHIIIILVASLFFYRMFEALFNKVNNSDVSKINQ